MRGTRGAAQTIATVLLSVGALRGWAGPPEQFRVWGTVAPDLPPPPKGWTELPPQPTGPIALRPTADEARRSYVVFARDPLLPVSPASPPFPSERVTELVAFAARGEYEPLSFGIYALEPLKGVSVQVSELRSDRGDLVPADHVDVRVVRCLRVPVDAKARTCRLAPYILEKRPAFDVAKGATAQVWLTLKVPDGAQGGDYGGTITIKAEGREAMQLKLSLHVFPFALPPAPVELAMFYPRPAEDDAMLLKELTDMREHGLNAFETPIGAEIVTRDQTFGDDDVAATRARCKRMMAAATKVFGKWQFPLTFEAGHQIAYYWDKERNWFVHWPHSAKIDGDLCKAIDVIREEAKAGGWPPLRAYLMDEAGAHNLLDEAVYYYGLVKKRYPEITTWTDIGGGIAMGNDEIGQLSDVVDFLSTNRFTPEIAAALVARKKPFGVYNGAGHTLPGPRYFFGFYGLKTGASQIAQWVYRFGDGGLRGLREDDEGYTYASPDGPLPTLCWEAVREGVDDYRYAHLLRQLCSLARESSATPTNDALKAAEQSLTAILSQIDWRFQALAGGERTPPPHPSMLRKWRRQVAAHIPTLLSLLRPGLRPPVPPVSPFDFEWAAVGQEEIRYGSELLPLSDFEAALKPWQVQPWNGKGTGALDTAEHHSGKQSARVEIPADSSTQATTVLVWPSWAGGGLSLSLAADRIYEFSAWVKWKGRSVPPSIRIALPEGAARATREGQDKPAADGWTRLWTRVEMNFPAAPKYLAVWVQGPGTVWVDDLSLREVIPQPLNVSLDQASYDDEDRVGFAAISVAKTISPASVRFSLGQAQLTAPFEVRADAAPPTQTGLLLLAPASLRQCQVAFDPSRLAPGQHEAKVELLDAAGNGIGAKSVVLTRLRTSAP